MPHNISSAFAFGVLIGAAFSILQDLSNRIKTKGSSYFVAIAAICTLGVYYEVTKNQEYYIPGFSGLILGYAFATFTQVLMDTFEVKRLREITGISCYGRDIRIEYLRFFPNKIGESIIRELKEKRLITDIPNLHSGESLIDINKHKILFERKKHILTGKITFSWITVTEEDNSFVSKQVSEVYERALDQQKSKC